MAAREDAEIKELSKKLEQNPDSMVFVQLADAFRRSGDLEKCVEICVQGLERHPTYTTARTILGRAYLDLGRLDEAAAEFKKIEVSDPENIVAQRMLGQIFMQKGLYGEAIVRHQKVLALDPDDTAAQEHLQEALSMAKQTAESGVARPKDDAPPQAPVQAAKSESSGTIKVAEIYIKKGAFDEAMEVLNEVLATDPENALAKQKVKEIDERRRQKSGADPALEAKNKADDEARKKEAAAEEAKRKADEEAKQKAAEEAKRKADEEAKQKAAEEAKRKADEEAKQKAAEEAKRRADEEAKQKAAEEAKRRADEEAKQKAAEEARRKADEEAKQKAAEDAKLKADEEARQKAADEAKRKAEEEASQKAAEEAKRKADEEANRQAAAAEAARQRADEEAAKKKNKLSSDDILSVMKSDDDELIGEAPAQAAAPASQAAQGAAPAKAGVDPAVKGAIEAFLKNNAMEASLLVSADGKLLDSAMPAGADAPALGTMASSIFSNTEKAAQRMRFGSLEQVIVSGEDGRQILFVALKSGVLVSVTGKGTNLGLLRIAINDLKKKA